MTLVANLPIGSVDSMKLAQDGTLSVSGWTFDPDTPTSPVTVTVTVDGTPHTVTANGSRPDVGAAFPAAGSAHGYGVTSTVGAGAHTVCVAFTDTTFTGTVSNVGCRTLS
jgi:hypothetical protein